MGSPTLTVCVKENLGSQDPVEILKVHQVTILSSKTFICKRIKKVEVRIFFYKKGGGGTKKKSFMD